MTTVPQTAPVHQSTTPLAADRQMVRETISAVAARAKAVMDPRLHGRIDQAQRLCLSGDVTRHADGTGTVGSQSNGSTAYHVNGRCDCRDADKAPGQWCKHRLSLAILARTEQALSIAEAQLVGQQDDDQAPDDAPPLPADPPTAAVTPETAFLAPFTVWIHGKAFVTYHGLLALARTRGLVSLKASFISVTETLALAAAEATFADGQTYSECADSTPQNVGATVKVHFPRIALTRAKARALRDALGVNMVALEELGD